MSVNYSRINFKNREVERPRTYSVTENQDGTITLTPSPGEVGNAGTPLNEANMNKLDKGVHDCAEAINELLEHVKQFTFTIPVGGWVQQSGYYTLSMAASGILASDTPDISIVQTGNWATDEQLRASWGFITRITTGSNTLLITASTTPEVALPIQVRCIRHG